MDSLHHLLGVEVVEPLVVGLETRRDGMVLLLRMVPGVLIHRTVTTADVSAFGAAAKM